MRATIAIYNSKTNVPKLVVRREHGFKTIPATTNYEPLLRHLIITLSNMGYDVTVEEPRS